VGSRCRTPSPLGTSRLPRETAPEIGFVFPRPVAGRIRHNSFSQPQLAFLRAVPKLGLFRTDGLRPQPKDVLSQRHEDTKKKRDAQTPGDSVALWLRERIRYWNDRNNRISPNLQTRMGRGFARIRERQEHDGPEAAGRLFPIRVPPGNPCLPTFSVSVEDAAGRPYVPQKSKRKQKFCPCRGRETPPAARKVPRERRSHRHAKRAPLGHLYPKPDPRPPFRGRECVAGIFR
jgi:hypothetical protein